jgi:hypothetical protein
VLALRRRIIVIIRASAEVLPSTFRIMKIEIAACLLGLALLPACSTTSQTTAQHQTLEQRLIAKYASTEIPAGEPAPPAEGPDDVPADAPKTVDDNPALMPSPLLRYWASSRTP